MASMPIFLGEVHAESIDDAYRAVGEGGPYSHGLRSRLLECERLQTQLGDHRP